jgi:hypothetical protein
MAPTPKQPTLLTPEILAFVREGPALQPPKGVIPNVNNHWDDEWLLYFVVSLCMAVIGISILIRMYTKLRIVKSFEAADYFIIGSFAFSINVLIFSRLALPHGWGAHQWNVQVKELFSLLYHINILEVLYGPLSFCIKMSVILQYLRMFAPNRTVNPFVFFGSWTIIILCTVFYTITTFLTVYACSPREKIWNKLYVGGHCMNYRAIIISTAFFNIVSDISILLLPVMTVWRMRIPTKKKVAISFLFGTGLVACIASSMRAVYTMRIIQGGAKADVTYNSVFTALWSYAECTLGIIVACMLSLPKLYQAKGGRLRTMYSGLAKKFSSGKSGESDNEKASPVHEIRLSEVQLKTWHSSDGSAKT